VKFRATLKNKAFIILVALGNGLFALFGGISLKEPTVTMLALILLAFTMIFSTMHRVRLYVFVNSEVLEARTLFSTRSIRWTDVQEIRSKAGGNTLDYITKNGSVRIRFDWFPRDCYAAVLKQVTARNIQLK
jgi:hypothetical protein